MSYKNTPRIDLNPSSADRWTTCTASPKFIFDNWDKLPPKDTTFSQEGTTAHEVAAAMLEDRLPKETDKYLCPVPVTAEMRRHAWEYWEYCMELIDSTNYGNFVEQKFPLWYMSERNARVDMAIFQESGLHIVDYKYGEGVVISPENNLQGAIYARSFIENETQIEYPRPDWPITIHIFQPRTRGEEPAHKWETTWKEIKDITNRVFHTAKMILAPDIESRVDLVFAPSEKACRWCPAKSFCTERSKSLIQDVEALNPLRTVDNKPMLPTSGVLTETQLAAIVRHGGDIKKWIDDAQAFALQLMRSGGKIPGFKLVTSRGGNRFWSDPIKVAKYLLEDTILRKDEIYTEPKLVGPAAVEKLIGKGQFPKRVYNLISKPPGQAIIVPEDDPRENALIDGASEFIDLDQF